MKGWFRFKFKFELDATWILERVWICGQGNLMLKRWSISFDPRKEQI